MKKILYNYLKPETTVIRMQAESFICQSGSEPNSVVDPADYNDGGEGFNW